MGPAPAAASGLSSGECTSQDERAFGRLLAPHRRGLELHCYLMLGDPDAAKRVMAEKVLSAWRERDLVEPLGDGLDVTAADRVTHV